MIVEYRKELLHLLIDWQISTLLKNLLVRGREWHQAFKGVDIAILLSAHSLIESEDKSLTMIFFAWSTPTFLGTNPFNGFATLPDADAVPFEPVAAPFPFPLAYDSGARCAR